MIEGMIPQQSFLEWAISLGQDNKVKECPIIRIEPKIKRVGGTNEKEESKQSGCN